MDIKQTVEAIYNLAKAGVTLELQEKIVELRVQAVSLTEELAGLREENRQLKDKVVTLT